MKLAAPSSQKADARPISFVLDDGLGLVTSESLVIRPEDLTVSDPSRINLQQTLDASGGAWGDNFGPGIRAITLSGHTGWRRTEGDMRDGQERFMELHNTCFAGWHAARKYSAQLGLDPNMVKLIYADSLDNIVSVVAPMNFTLRRSKSRPLLCQFQIQLMVISDDVMGNFNSVVSGFTAPLQALGLDSLTASVNEITAAIGIAQTFITGNLVAPVANFMHQTARLYGAVNTAISAGSGLAASLVGVAQMTSQSGLNLFRTMAAVANLPNTVRSQLMQVAGAYSNIFCVLGNALQQGSVYQDYSALYGSSNCSSTNGGRPLSAFANVNPFYSIQPTQPQLPVSVTSLARTSMLALAGADVALAPMSMTTLGAHVQNISNGLVVTA